MTLWRVREFQQDDLDAVVRIWDDPKAGGLEPVFGLSELLTAVRAGQPTVVATVGDEIVGTAVAAAARRSGMDLAGGPGYRLAAAGHR